MTEPTSYWNAPRGTTMYACKDGEYVSRDDYARLEQECERLRTALEFIAKLHIIPPYMTPQASQLILVKGHADAALSGEP